MSELLLTPIDAAMPSGASMRFEPAYDEIRRLREEDDPTLPQGVWQRELKRADWPGVATRCIEVLSTKTKDLQLAAWLTEAWVRIDGFPGGARGIRLIAAFCRDFWDSVHPAIDAGGSLDARLAPLLWLADKLPFALKTVHVCAPAGEDALPYGWKEYEAGLYLTQLTRKSAAAAASSEKGGMVPEAKFHASVALTPARWFVPLAADLQSLRDAVAELDAVLDERCGREAPSLASLRDLATTIHRFVAHIIEERTQKGELMPPTPPEPIGLPGSEPEASQPEELSPAGPAIPTRQAGPIQSRADAYARLRECADYLLRTEPHSPVPYLVLRAVAWGDMSVAQLYEELFQRNGDLPTIYALLGIRRPE